MKHGFVSESSSRSRVPSTGMEVQNELYMLPVCSHATQRRGMKGSHQQAGKGATCIHLNLNSLWLQPVIASKKTFLLQTWSCPFLKTPDLLGFSRPFFRVHVGTTKIDNPPHHHFYRWYKPFPNGLFILVLSTLLQFPLPLQASINANQAAVRLHTPGKWINPWAASLDPP